MRDEGHDDRIEEEAMRSPQAVVNGTLNPDGTLVLDEKPDLPSGRVQVALTHVESPQPPKEDWFEVLERIDREREALGMVSRSKEEIDAEVQALRDELDARLAEIERIREEIRRSKEEPGC
jgi:hypothetical protein